ncbi:catechol 2,3-dioxygenase-like lactoylglutathione lyase family enzyme [Paenibacillus castaneae]|nr:catechol 2,3-dioxygenase-like lactoylglutathione lyase family enzyme [Paenibacillus castaneae]
MNFTSVRIIIDDVDRFVEFYEKVMGVSVERPAPVLRKGCQLLVIYITLHNGFLFCVIIQIKGKGITTQKNKSLV